MSDQTGQNIEASVLAERESERENERSQESKESEEMREMRDEIAVMKRALEEQKLRAQRDALAAEVERGAGGGRRREELRGVQHRRLLCLHLGWEPNQACRNFLCLALI